MLPSQQISFLGTVIDSDISADDSKRSEPRRFSSTWLPSGKACQFFLPDIWGHHVLVHSNSKSVVSYIKSPGRPCLEATLHAGERPSCVGSDQSALTEGDVCAGQNEPMSRHVVEDQCPLQRMDAPPARVQKI